MPRTVVGLDIGGANLKAASSTGQAVTVPFPLWKNPAGLSAALVDLLGCFPTPDLLAVTMTGELCDCYESKRQGVGAILHAVQVAASQIEIQAWRNDGQFVDLTTARESPLQVAAANWLALATFAGRFAPSGPTLLLDVGSTTTDIIFLRNGQPMPRGRTDPERLQSGELVYQGVRRTPLCVFGGGSLAAELFATTLDIHLVLGHIPENQHACDTADGRPATRRAAHARIARMLCADEETSSDVRTLALAEQVFQTQISMLAAAIERVASDPPETVILAGSGEFLARASLAAQPRYSHCRAISLADLLGPQISQAACAYAVAVCAAERKGWA